MAITTGKQRQALEAKGWTLTDVKTIHVGATLTQTSARETWGRLFESVTLFGDGNLSTYGVNRYRLAEFLSIINAKDDSVIVEGEVRIGYEVVVVGDSTTHDMLDKFNGKRVRITIEPIESEGNA